MDPSSKLGAFFEETKDDSPDVRAEKLEAHKAISEVHDEVAKQGQTSVSATHPLRFLAIAKNGRSCGKFPIFCDPSDNFQFQLSTLVRMK